MGGLVQGGDVLGGLAGGLVQGEMSGGVMSLSQAVYIFLEWFESNGMCFFFKTFGCKH